MLLLSPFVKIVDWEILWSFIDGVGLVEFECFRLLKGWNLISGVGFLCGFRV